MNIDEHHRPMTDPESILQRIEDFDEENGGGVHKRRGGYTFTLTKTQVPIARLKPVGSGDMVPIYD